MEATGTLPPPPEPPEPGPAAGTAADRPPLRRSRDDRILFGVCGGLARHFGVDPVLVRVAAVLTLIFGGLGILVYAAAVLLIPDDGESEPLLRARGPLWARVAGALLLVAAVAVLLRTVFGGGGPWVPLPLILLGGAILYVALRRRRSRAAGTSGARGRVGLVAFGVVLILGGVLGAVVAGGAVSLDAGGVIGALAVITGLVVAASSFWGRPYGLIALGVLLLGVGAAVVAADLDLSGGVGKRVYTLSGATASRYRLAVGSLELDASRAPTARGAATVDAQLGIGRLLIDVPGDSAVSIGGATESGDNRKPGGIDVTRDVVIQGTSGTTHIHAHVGMGVIDVRRADGPAPVSVNGAKSFTVGPTTIGVQP